MMRNISSLAYCQIVRTYYKSSDSTGFVLYGKLKETFFSIQFDRENNVLLFYAVLSTLCW